MHPLTPEQRSLQLRARELAQGQFAPTAGGTAQILRTQVASAVLGMKLPQTRGGYRSATASRNR